MTETSYIQPMPEYTSIIPAEQYRLFCLLVHEILNDNNWMLLEEAQRYAYQQVLFKNMQDID